MARPRYPDLNCELLERERKRQELSFADLARKCRALGDVKVDDRALSRYERGEVRPSPDRLRVIAQALGTAADELLAVAA